MGSEGYCSNYVTAASGLVTRILLSTAGLQGELVVHYDVADPVHEGVALLTRL